MPRMNLSLPHERRKASLRAAELKLRVKQQEVKQQLTAVRTELSAMKPKNKSSGDTQRLNALLGRK